jgi:hypothetical protein
MQYKSDIGQQDIARSSSPRRVVESQSRPPLCKKKKKKRKPRRPWTLHLAPSTQHPFFSQPMRAMWAKPSRQYPGIRFDSTQTRRLLLSTQFHKYQNNPYMKIAIHRSLSLSFTVRHRTAPAVPDDPCPLSSPFSHAPKRQSSDSSISV